VPGQTGRAALVSIEYSGHLLAEGLPAATSGTKQTPYPHPDYHPPPVDRDICLRPSVIAVHTTRRPPAHETDRGLLRSPCPHHDPLTPIGHILDDQRGQPRKHRLHKRVDIRHMNINDAQDTPSPPNVRQAR